MKNFANHLFIFAFVLGFVFLASCKKDNDSKPDELQLTLPSPTIFVGDSFAITYSPSSISIADLKWTSSDEDIASVNEYGMVKTLKEGEVTITVTHTNGMTANCTFKIMTCYDPSLFQFSICYDGTNHQPMFSPFYTIDDTVTTDTVHFSSEAYGSLVGYPRRGVFRIRSQESGDRQLELMLTASVIWADTAANMDNEKFLAFIRGRNASIPLKASGSFFITDGKDSQRYEIRQRNGLKDLHVVQPGLLTDFNTVKDSLNKGLILLTRYQQTKSEDDWMGFTSYLQSVYFVWAGRGIYLPDATEIANSHIDNSRVYSLGYEDHAFATVLDFQDGEYIYMPDANIGVIESGYFDIVRSERGFDLGDYSFDIKFLSPYSDKLAYGFILGQNTNTGLIEAVNTDYIFTETYHYSSQGGAANAIKRRTNDHANDALFSMP